MAPTSQDGSEDVSINSSKVSPIGKINPLELYRLQTDLLHQQINHILLIRGWSTTLTAALIVSISAQHEPIIGLGVLLVMIFGGIDYVYGIHFEAYNQREIAIRGWLASEIPNEKVKDVLSRTAVSPRLRKLYYATMVVAIIATSIFFAIPQK